MRKQKGFSLIELLIVVAIILIIAAIAIPNLLRSRMAANEASAVGSIRTINTAQVTYASTYPNTGYAATLTMLGPPAAGVAADATAAGLLDNVLGCAGGAACNKSGYAFQVQDTIAGPPVSAYMISGDPLTINSTGTRYFCSNADAVVRGQQAAAVATRAACEALTALQ
jgi:prepilin-type N-terminal cleavage/methylation domain-containing protein